MSESGQSNLLNPNLVDMSYSLWMRLIPGTHRYHCLECREKFVLLQSVLH